MRFWRALARLWPLAVAAVLAACATPQSDALRAQRPPGAALGIAEIRELDHVPFYAQERDHCGPATLAMALGASGLTRDPESIDATVFVPGRAGSLAPEMLAAARRQGRLAVQLPPNLVSVLREVDAGNPVIVLQNLGLSFYPVWHYALVIGYDVGNDQILMHSGPQPRMRMSLELFEHTWTRGGSWAMVAVAPSRLPVTPSSEALVAAAAALERVDSGAAHAAYLALSRRTPENFGAWMGLGNSAFAMGDTTGAVAAFTRASELQPQNADSWNNLASALLARGAKHEARAAIERALALGGSHRAVYERTAAEIEQAERAP
ncbi:MAG TPA: PA2778 family cysteine peptidase [Burkholderiaceae bacterium]|nr:PA2778 family cysteine peptidase [Burkholderiaceae bacterium]